MSQQIISEVDLNNAVAVSAIAALLIDKGLITRREFDTVTARIKVQFEQQMEDRWRKFAAENPEAAAVVAAAAAS